MTARVSVPSRIPIAERSTFIPARARMLQRKCACGGTARFFLASGCKKPFSHNRRRSAAVGYGKLTMKRRRRRNAVSSALFMFVAKIARPRYDSIR